MSIFDDIGSWMANFTPQQWIGDAMGAQSGAYNRSTGIQQQTYGQDRALAGNVYNQDASLMGRTYNQNAGLQQPWVRGGQQSLGQLLSGLKSGAFSPSVNPQNLANDPGYQFQMQQAQQALQRSAAASGGLNSGAFMKGLDQYSQGIAGQQFQNAWNRDFQAKQANYQNLAGVAGMGMNAAQNIGQLGQGYSSNMGQLGSNYSSLMGQLGQGYANGMTGVNQNYADSMSRLYGDESNAFQSQLGQFMGQLGSAPKTLGNLGGSQGGIIGLLAGLGL